MADAMIVYALLDPDTKLARYVGQTVYRGETRLSNHISSARRKKRPKVLGWISRLLGQGKRPVLMEIERYESHAELMEGEVYWIAQFRGLGAKLLNILPGGESTAGFRHSEAMKDKLRAITGERHPNFGRVTPPDVREKLSMKTREWLKTNPPNQLGRKASPEARQKQSNAQLGVPMNLTQEQRLRKADRHRELWKDPEFRAKIAGRKGLLNPNTVVIVVDGVKRWVKDIAQEVGMNPSAVRRRFNKHLIGKESLTISDFSRKLPERYNGPARERMDDEPK